MDNIIPQTILYIIIILLYAKVLGELAERIGQPPVLGELIAGVILGSSVLGWIKPNDALLVFAELGVILLLFEIGLESDIKEFLSVGPSALLVAIIGVVLPFAFGYLVSYYVFHLANTVSIFVGATLTATSVGITARTLTDLGRLKAPEAKIILGAAVVDDVIGLIILAVVTGLVTHGSVSALDVAKTSILAIAFLVGAIVIGLIITPHILQFVKTLRTRGILTISAILFCLILAYIAHKLHLATIVGAFAAGLVLARTDDTAHIQDRVKPIADIFVPIFFVMLGTSVNLSLFNPFNPEMHSVIYLMLTLSAIAVLMKIFSGFGVLKKGVNKLVVGVGMIPRGEVGLIFASIGLARNIINPGEYASIVAIVVITTFITPPLLKFVLRKFNTPDDSLSYE